MKKIITVVAALCFVMGGYAEDLTCQQAYEAAMQLQTGATGTEDVTVHGIITSTDGTVSRKQQVFWMADDIDGGQVFEAYWANLPEPYATNGTPLPVGTELKLTGKLMNYQDRIAEIKNGNIELINVPVIEVDTIDLTADEAIEEAIVWSVGDISTDYYRVSGKVKEVTKPYVENQNVPGYNGNSSFTLEVSNDSIAFTAYSCYSVEEVFAGDSVIVLGTLQLYAANNVEISGGKVTITKQDHAEAQIIEASVDESIAEALNHDIKWLSTDIYIVTGTVDSISYAYSEEKGTLSFYMATTNDSVKFCAYNCKSPRALEVGEVVSVKGHLQLFAADLAEISNGEVMVTDAVWNVKSDAVIRKRLENGQLIIYRNGARYTATGVNVQ